MSWHILNCTRNCYGSYRDQGGKLSIAALWNHRIPFFQIQSYGMESSFVYHLWITEIVILMSIESHSGFILTSVCNGGGVFLSVTSRWSICTLQVKLRPPPYPHPHPHPLIPPARIYNIVDGQITAAQKKLKLVVMIIMAVWFEDLKRQTWIEDR